jgi:hypothetical protein
LSFIDNSVETKIPEFRCFVIQELPRLKFLDWLPITKEERAKATKLESDGVWAAKSSPLKDTPSPRAGSSTAITRHSVSYNKDTVEAAKNGESGGTEGNRGAGSEATTAASKETSATGSTVTPGAPSPFRGLPTSASTPSPVLRHTVVPYRESSQFNDFSALG